MEGPRHKGFYILPNLLTTASLFSGFMGILWAVEGNYVLCAVAILISCFFDGLDGKVARITKANSNFGVQFDSLADLVSFAVSPALMIYLWQTHVFGRIGVMASFLFIACSALRLARFNLQSQNRTGKYTKTNKFFVGLPVPAAACTMATLVLFSTYLPAEALGQFIATSCLILLYALSLLMISRVRYASFKEVEMVKAHPFTASVAAIMLFALVASEPKFLGFIFFMAYLLSGLIYTFLIFPLRNGTFLRGLSRQKLS
jgi:CDP-diacylglycerol--serine O-phosphatidyltransferase